MTFTKSIDYSNTANKQQQFCFMSGMMKIPLLILTFAILCKYVSENFDIIIVPKNKHPDLKCTQSCRFVCYRFFFLSSKKLYKQHRSFISQSNTMQRAFALLIWSETDQTAYINNSLSLRVQTDPALDVICTVRLILVRRLYY